MEVVRPAPVESAAVADKREQFLAQFAEIQAQHARYHLSLCGFLTRTSNTLFRFQIV